MIVFSVTTIVKAYFISFTSVLISNNGRHHEVIGVMIIIMMFEIMILEVIIIITDNIFK